MNTLPQDIINKITLLLDLESVLIFKAVFKRNVYVATTVLYTAGMHTEYTWDNCARKGLINVIKFLDNQKVPGCTYMTATLAAENGHIQTLKWLMSHRTEGHSDLAIDKACVNNHYSAVVYLYMRQKEPYRIHYAKTSNVVILIDSLKCILENLDENPFLDNITDIRQEVYDCLSRLYNSKSHLECYSDLKVLKYTYIGSVVSLKKYSGLIRSYISDKMKEQSFTNTETNAYFKSCKMTIRKLLHQ